jgi:methylated-DNA-[protein]-cysteine S-methyltransferase
MDDFGNKVLFACRKIPKGKVSTYKEIAKFMKNPNSSRAVGNALNKNPDTKFTPCHRVVKSNGEVGGYAKGTKKKILILKKEGVEIINGKIDLEKYLFRL